MTYAARKQTEAEKNKLVLETARFYIEKPEDWTQGTAARDDYGDPVEACHMGACKWCATGALIVAMNVHGVNINHARPLVRSLLAQIGNTYASIVEWNDAPGRTHAGVLAIFDNAIAAMVY